MREHKAPSGAFVFQAPESWKVDRSSTRADVFEAAGDGMIVRFVHRSEESGFDSVHVACMDDRLADAIDVDPRVHYEYDFEEGQIGDRRVLDSAFKTLYDKPVHGHREWRQRNVTYVGGGQSLCIIAFCPMPVWKKSSEARKTLDAVVSSVTVR
jgi:hypothetical protein